MTNARFAEYATSGAFSLSLSRNQVSALSMVANGAEPFGISTDVLERKGLVIAVANPAAPGDDRMEFRPTLAGLLCARLVREAGLTNGPDDPLAAELSALRSEVERCRTEAVDASRRAWSAMARKEEAERELALAQRDLRLARDDLRGGPRLRPEYRREAFEAPPCIRLRDHHPELTDAELMAPLSASRPPDPQTAGAGSREELND